MLSVMEGEIVRTGEAGGFRLQGIQPVLVPLPLTLLKCQMSALFAQFKCYYFYHIQYGTSPLGSLSLISLNLTQSSLFLSNSWLQSFISVCLYAACHFFLSLSMLTGQ